MQPLLDSSCSVVFEDKKGKVFFVRILTYAPVLSFSQDSDVKAFFSCQIQNSKIITSNENLTCMKY